MKKNYFSGREKIVRKCILLLAVVILFACYANYRVVETGSSFILNSDNVPECEAILVLGAYVSPAGVASRMLDARLQEGYELYKKGKADKIIVSGDHGRKDYDEVNAMKKYYLDRGIPSDKIFMDHAGFTTYESMYRSSAIFKASKIVVVTQEFHLFRAIYIARALGLETYGVRAANGDYGKLVMLSNEVREIVARSKAFISAAVKPKPTFLGEAIPVSGDGRLTDDKK